jgi:hypothetical protein
MGGLGGARIQSAHGGEKKNSQPLPGLEPFVANLIDFYHLGGKRDLYLQ